MIEKKKKILITGHQGLLGSEIIKRLKKNKYKNIFFISKNKLDLRDSNRVLSYFKKMKFDYVYSCAAKVGGIMANVRYPQHFLCNNLEITLNIAKACYETKVRKMLFIGSSCIYPQKTKQPIKEEFLLTSSIAISSVTFLGICAPYLYIRCGLYFLFFLMTLLIATMFSLSSKSKSYYLEVSLTALVIFLIMFLVQRIS